MHITVLVLCVDQCSDLTNLENQHIIEKSKNPSDDIH